MCVEMGGWMSQVPQFSSRAPDILFRTELSNPYQSWTTWNTDYRNAEYKITKNSSPTSPSYDHMMMIIIITTIIISPGCWLVWRNIGYCWRSLRVCVENQIHLQKARWIAGFRFSTHPKLILESIIHKKREHIPNFCFYLYFNVPINLIRRSRCFGAAGADGHRED